MNLTIGARAGSIGVSHFDVSIFVGKPNQTRALAGSITLRAEEVDPFVQLVTEAQLNSATVGEHVAAGQLERTCIHFWQDHTGTHRCARDQFHRGQHVAADENGLVTAIWLLTEVAPR